MSWYVARSLDQLLAEINSSAPARSKASDGSIGDTSHSSRDSDHNPCDCHDAVCARDYTHDPAHGFDSYTFANWLRERCATGAENRVSYIISNGRIASQTYGFVWKPYDGSNPHDHHVHVSVEHPVGVFDDTSSWGWSATTGGDLDMATPEDVWDVPMGKSGVDMGVAQQRIYDSVMSGQAVWNRPLGQEGFDMEVALQRIYTWCNQMQADIKDLKAQLG
jgi:hypothetical protein